VRLLLEYKGDIEAKNKSGKTALQKAIDENKSEVVEVLEAAAAAKKEGISFGSYMAKREAEEEVKCQAEVTAIGGLGALMQSLGLDAQTSLAAARFCQTNGAERVEDLDRSDFAEQLARELGVSEVMAAESSSSKLSRFCFTLYPSKCMEIVLR